MKCYSVPKRILHAVFGGSAIWLGTTFCSPLVAADIEQPPTPASAPDALAVPDTTDPSLLPPAPMEVPAPTPKVALLPPGPQHAETPGHWDNGPVYADDYCDYDSNCPDECCDDYYGEDEYVYDYADPEDAYADYAATDESPTDPADVDMDDCWYDEECCGEYAYDGYDNDESDVSSDAVATETAEQNEDESYYEDCYEDYGYDEEYVYHYDESDDSVEAAPADKGSTAADADSVVEDDFPYEFDDYEMYYGDEADLASEEPAESETEAAGVAVESQRSEWEDYYYEDNYDCDEFAGDSPSTVDEMAAEDTPVEEPATEDTWADECDYGYEDEYGSYDETASDDTPVEESATEESWADEYDYSYDYEYDGYDETDDDESMADESTAKDTWDEEYGYEYEYDSYDYDANNYDSMDEMNDAYGASGISDEQAEPAEEAYDYVDPMDQYGYEYDVPYDWQAMDEQVEPEIDSDLFARQPADLLCDADLKLIRTLSRLADAPTAERRARLNDYIESLGFEAIDFAYRYEDATEADVLTLADDLPGTAAFLATYRLVEQGAVPMDDGVVLLEEALDGMSLDWIEGISRVTVANQVISASHPVVSAMAAVATRSITTVNNLTTSLSERISTLPWNEISGRFSGLDSASRPTESGDTFAF